MRFVRTAAAPRYRIGREWTDGVPFLRIHILIEIGENDLSALHSGHLLQQGRNGRGGRGDTSGDDETGWCRLCPTAGDMVQQAVATIRHVDHSTIGQHLRPYI